MSKKNAVVSLRTVAERVGLASCSVSAILNKTAASMAIPQRTKDRVLRAAAELNYRPNLWARSLRTKRTRMVAVITSDISLAPVARVLAGVQNLLQRKGYLLAVGSGDSSNEWRDISIHLQQRGIEGIVAIDATLPPEIALPVVSVDLNSMPLLGPVSADMRTWLIELGQSAAETLINRIEKKTVPGGARTRTVPTLPGAYFALSHSITGTDGDNRRGA